MLAGPEYERLRRALLTYSEVGRTRGGDAPAGYLHVTRSVVVGSGVDRFQEAATALCRWEMHRRAAVSVRPSSESVVDGAVAVLRLGRRSIGVDAPVRVVYVVEEDRRRGFAYGTLPGHPESGEEAFLVELADDERVVLTISAFSRPASRLARLGGPMSRWIQRRVTNRYLRAV